MVMLFAAAGAALAAAVCFAMASAAQHFEAARTEPDHAFTTGLLGRLLRRPIWWLGVAAGAGGVALQLLALAWGPLVLVAPLLVSELLFALPASMLLRQRRPEWAEWGWALLLVVGLALFLIAANPTSHGGGHSHALLAGTAAVAVGTAILVTAGIRAPSRYRAVLLGTATGAGFGLASALGKYCLGLLHAGTLPLLTNWPLWVLITTVTGASLLAQAAFHAGKLSASLPPMTLAEPLVGIALGVGALSESLHTSAPALTGQILGGLAMTTAITQLARYSTPQPPSPQP